MPLQPVLPNCFYRISAKALILNEQKEFLLCKEQNGKWELPGGGIDFGEDPQSCIARELQEEMGLQTTFIANSPVYMTTFLRSDATQWMCNVLFETTVEHLNFTPSDECIAIGWFIKERAQSLPMHTNVQLFIDQFDPLRH